MEKLQMCRICLVQNVRMYVVINKNLHELYEKLTNIPFVTEDHRPMLACFICCTKLKQCCRFLRKCLEAEELFTRMINEDYEQDSLLHKQRAFYEGFIKAPIENISIVDIGQTESLTIKEEFPAVFESLDDIVEANEEHLTGDVDDIPAFHSESDLEDDELLTVVKTEVEDEQESIGAPVTKNPKLETPGTNPGDKITVEQNKNEHTSVHDSSNNTRILADEKPFKCKICQRSFKYKSLLTIHIRIHTGEKPFKCDICQRSFRKKTYLALHISVHTTGGNLKCNICQRSFKYKSHFSRHIHGHPDGKPFKCDICQHSFYYKSHLTIHKRVHTGEKPFKCDICQRSFINKSIMKCHIRIHTGEKPFKCDICQRSFRQKNVLAAHSRVHTGEKPFKCDICQRSFGNKANLTRHVRTHTGEKPFKCDICQSSFNQKRTLTRHNRFIHSIHAVE